MFNFLILSYWSFMLMFICMFTQSRIVRKFRKKLILIFSFIGMLLLNIAAVSNVLNKEYLSVLLTVDLVYLLSIVYILIFNLKNNKKFEKGTLYLEENSYDIKVIKNWGFINKQLVQVITYNGIDFIVNSLPPSYKPPIILDYVINPKNNNNIATVTIDKTKTALTFKKVLNSFHLSVVIVMDTLAPIFLVLNLRDELSVNYFMSCLMVMFGTSRYLIKYSKNLLDKILYYFCLLFELIGYIVLLF